MCVCVCVIIFYVDKGSWETHMTDSQQLLKTFPKRHSRYLTKPLRTAGDLVRREWPSQSPECRPPMSAKHPPSCRAITLLLTQGFGLWSSKKKKKRHCTISAILFLHKYSTNTQECGDGLMNTEQNLQLNNLPKREKAYRDVWHKPQWQDMQTEQLFLVSVVSRSQHNCLLCLAKHC